MDLGEKQVATVHIPTKCAAHRCPVIAPCMQNNRFNRVLAVYQVLPGPEATEMACYFGILVHGRIGAILSGLGFILPGFCLMLLLAYIYVEVGLDSEVVFGLFSGLQPAVAAMVFRATHKLADSTLTDVKKEVDWRLGMTALMATFESILKVNFFITLVHCALLYGVFLKPGRNLAGLFVGVLPLAAFIAIVVTLGGFEKLVPMGVGAGALGNNAGTNFLVGLLGGLLTFGGAYTAIPFMQYEAVETGHWVSNTVFLQSLAVGAVLPTPLVMFSTFVGYCANGIVGAVLMTLGMFIPAFSFTVIGHHFFEKVVSARGMLRAALDGVTAGVIGLIAVTAVTLLRAAVRQPLDVVVFMLALGATYHFKSKYTNFMVVIFAGLAGQILYVG